MVKEISCKERQGGEICHCVLRRRARPLAQISAMLSNLYTERFIPKIIVAKFNKESYVDDNKINLPNV